MPGDMAPPKCTCADCGKPFGGKPGEIWCADCLPTVEAFPVELSAAQRERLKALAVVRNVTPQEVLRQALAAIGARSKSKRLTPADQSEAERLRPGATPKRRSR